MKKILSLTGLVLVSLAIYVTFFSPSPDLLSPLSSSKSATKSSIPDPKSYVVLGFAPYWNLKKLSPESLTSITHFAYFNLHLNGDGSLYTKVNRREEDPGYTNYKRLINCDVWRYPFVKFPSVKFFGNIFSKINMPQCGFSFN